jgi:hypothetical protein
MSVEAVENETCMVIQDIRSFFTKINGKAGGENKGKSCPTLPLMRS